MKSPIKTYCSNTFGSTAAVSGSTSERYSAGKVFSNDCANLIIQMFDCPINKSMVSLSDFIHYALYRTRLHVSVAISALVLLQRLKSRYPNAKGSSGHRLWLAAIMISNKMFNDDSFTNQSWFIASQQIFTQREVNAVERELFGYLSCEVRVTINELISFTKLFNVWRKSSYEQSQHNSIPSSPVSTIQKLNKLNYNNDTPALSPVTNSSSSSATQTPISTPPTPNTNNLISAAANKVSMKKKFELNYNNNFNHFNVF